MSRHSVVHIPSFEGAYETGLVFAMIEGLKQGEAFKLICDQEPRELESLLRAANVSRLRWSSQKSQAGRWELLIEKADARPFSDASVPGCCGMCGGDSAE